MYQDEDGNDVDLTTLCRRAPAWAANRIVKLEDDLRQTKDTVSRLVDELRLASMPLAQEPDPMVLMPVAAWYAAENGISGGKFRELVRLWVRGATSDELRAMLPGEEK